MSQATRTLRSANLNLVPVLRALLREESVTRAAALLALSPSATSCALAELRLLFGDPLLIRVGREMRRTSRAEQLIARLESACSALEDLLREEAFDPATVQRAFVIAAPDYFDLLLGPRLVAAFRESAPGARARFVDIPDDLERQLALGNVDIGLGDLRHLRWPGLASSPGAEDRLVAILDSGHPLAGSDRVEQVDLARYPSVAWDPGPGLLARTDSRLSSMPLTVDARLRVQSMSALPMMLVGSDLVAVVPAAFARHCTRRLSLAMVDVAIDTPTIATGLLWHPVQDADPVHRWCRTIIASALIEAHTL